MIRLIRAQPIVDRLIAGGFREVAGVLEWAGLKAAPAHSPALFVIPDRETARPNEMSGIHDQRVATMFRVVIVLKPKMRVDGGPSRELEEQIVKVIDALIGWKHPDASGACDYAGGRLIAADGWGVAWAVDFTAAWRLRKGNS